MKKEEQVRKLWKENFNDSETFIQFYFTHKYSDENSLVYEENGEALSAFLMLPYPMTWQGIQLTSSYISGACTIKKARNRGLMTLLLTEAFREMNQRGIALSTLIPAEDWLFGYYGNLGYVSVFDYSFEEHIPGTHPADPAVIVRSTPEYVPSFADELFPYFEQKMQNRSCCIQHPQEDYAAIIEENYIGGGRLLATYTSGEISGWALACPGNNNQVLLKESLYQSEKEKNALLEAVADIWHPHLIRIRQLPSGNFSNSYGMARITDVFRMLDHIAVLHPDLVLTLGVNDPQLEANQGIYKLSHGTCQKDTTNSSTPDVITDIPNLTKALLGYHNDQSGFILGELSNPQIPYMNLMLD